MRTTGLALSFEEDDRVEAIAAPFQMADAAIIPPRMPPSIGQHSDEILAGLGYDPGPDRRPPFGRHRRMRCDAFSADKVA